MRAALSNYCDKRVRRILNEGREWNLPGVGGEEDEGGDGADEDDAGGGGDAEDAEIGLAEVKLVPAHLEVKGAGESESGCDPVG